MVSDNSEILGDENLIQRIISKVKSQPVKYLARLNPFLAAVFPVIFLYANNIDEAPFMTASAVLLAVLIGTVIFMLVLRLVIRNDGSASFLAVSWLLLFFSYGHILELIAGANIGGFVFGRVRFLFPAEVVVAFLALFVVLKYRNFCHGITPFITVALLVPFLFTWASIGLYHLQGPESVSAGSDEILSVELPDISPDQLPDIYYIILDSYPREDVLSQVFGFDNSQFLEYLQQNDFYVASQSQTNYVTTQVSLPSSLNMDYLQRLVAGQSADSSDVSILITLIEDNKAALFAKRMGYQFAFLGSTLNLTMSNQHADEELYSRDYPLGGLGKIVLRPLLGNDFGYSFLRTTLLRSGIDAGFIFIAADLFNDKIDKLKNISEVDAPTFTFAHFVPPHHPLLFDREGNIRSVTFALQSYIEKEPYIDQLVWVNKSIQRAISDILENNKENSVIVLQGDHGSNATDIEGVLFDGRPPDATFIHERTSILNAFHLPESCKDSGLYQSITPVNTFRLIFDSCWGTEFGLLEDQTYWSSLSRPYDFTPIEEIGLEEIGLNKPNP